MKENGQTSETVYRDKHGRKVDVIAKFEEHQREKKRREEADEIEQKQVKKGAVQKMDEEAFRKEQVRIQSGSFARKIDDETLEQQRKDVLREGDPMFEMEMKKRATQTGRTGKPLYKGPSPKPNRFGIRPGYRWDGNARGNGFEDKVLAHIHGQKAKKEAAYKWSVSDM